MNFYFLINCSTSLYNRPTITDGSAKFALRMDNPVVDVHGGGNTLEIIKRDGSSSVIKNSIYVTSLGYIYGKTIAEIKTILKNEIRKAYNQGYDFVRLKAWGNMFQFFPNITNDNFVLPAGALFTIEISNITVDGTYAHIELYTYGGWRHCSNFSNDSFGQDYINTSNIGRVPELLTKLSSLESRIQALENK